MKSEYIPKLDRTEDLDANDTQFYQEMMGMHCWATEIGRVEILHKISILYLNTRPIRDKDTWIRPYIFLCS